MEAMISLKNIIPLIFPISISLLWFPCMVLLNPTFTKLLLPNAVGPASFAFERSGGGPITSVNNGRLLKYQGPSTGFTPYGFVAAASSTAQCNTTADLGPICGRPLGIAFDYGQDLLYIADAYIGLLVKRTSDIQATSIATSAEGVRFRFLNGVDVDPQTGIVYFTDSSSVFQLRNLTQAIQAGDSTGRFLKYNPGNNQVSVLMRNLSLPVGTAVSGDGTFVLVAEFNGQRIIKYWIKGPKANTSEVLINVQGNPDNIRRTFNSPRDFWVAVNVEGQTSTSTTVPTGQRINGLGTVLQTVNPEAQYNSTVVGEVQERLGKLYIGALFVDFVGVYTP